MVKMKTNRVHGALSKFKSVSNFKKSNSMIFYSRQKPVNGQDRYIEVIDQGGNAIALPIIIEADGTERVAYHPKTIKGLVEFLENKGGE
jgi:hypothetical protein